MNSAKHLTASRRGQCGFFMIEVLVAALVFSFALLGLAGLQAVGARANHDAYLRTQAVQLAQDMSDRMRANLDGVRNGDYDNLSGDGALQSCVSSPSGCNPAQMAQHDLAKWQQAVAATLPANSEGWVVRSGDVLDITVSWDEQRSGATGTGCGSDLDVDMSCYRLRVKL